MATDLSKISDFLLKGTMPQTISKTDKQVLDSWRESTVTSYNAAVKKFGKFKKAMNKTLYGLSLTPKDKYRFVTWAGRGKNNNKAEKITAPSLTKYLHSLKAWHTFHDATYPHHTEVRIKLMVKASGQKEARQPLKSEKAPVLIQDLWNLKQSLTDQGSKADVAKDLAIVAFWGMARIAELTYMSPTGHIPYKQGLTLNDVEIYPEATLLTLHEAKTAKPGKTQTIKLRPRQGPLCPVKAITQRIMAVTDGSTSLFGYYRNGTRTHLTKRRTNKIFSAAWHTLQRPELSGHPFCVGGASLRGALDISVDKIKSLGRWTSDCYQRYIKPLLEQEIAVLVNLLTKTEFS
jgi:hypothetical protein